MDKIFIILVVINLIYMFSSDIKFNRQQKELNKKIGNWFKEFDKRKKEEE